VRQLSRVAETKCSYHTSNNSLLHCTVYLLVSCTENVKCEICLGRFVSLPDLFEKHTILVHKIPTDEGNKKQSSHLNRSAELFAVFRMISTFAVKSDTLLRNHVPVYPRPIIRNTLFHEVRVHFSWLQEVCANVQSVGSLFVQT